MNDEHPNAIGLNDVEVGRNYALLISTNAGLWRYMIGDTIKFTSISPYRIRITGRTKHFINAFGEELIIENADQAIKYACDKTHAVIEDYTAGPYYIEKGKKGGHEWIIEFRQVPDNQQAFIELLDKKLRDLNSDYDAKRYKNLALDMPKVHFARTGTFYDWMKRRGKLGGQNKVPRLSNNRVFLDEILPMLEVFQS